jgi:hypothetical protein
MGMPGNPTYAPYPQQHGSNNKLLILVLAALVVVGGVIGAILVLKSGGDGKNPAAANDSEQPSGPGADTTVPTQEEMEKGDTEKATPVPEAASEVEITIGSFPEDDASVFVGDGTEPIGKTPFVKKFPKGNEPIELRFEKEGFVTRTKRLIPNQKRDVEIQIARLVAEPSSDKDSDAAASRARRDRDRVGKRRDKDRDKDDTTKSPIKEEITDDDFAIIETPAQKKKKKKKKKPDSDLMDFE